MHIFLDCYGVKCIYLLIFRGAMTFHKIEAFLNSTVLGHPGRRRELASAVYAAKMSALIFLQRVKIIGYPNYPAFLQGILKYQKAKILYKVLYKMK